METSDQSEKQAKKRKFSDAWLTDEQFKPWIGKVPSNDNQFHCKMCKKNFSCSSLSHVKRHARSAQHKKRLRKNSSDDEDDDDDDDDYNELPSKKKPFCRKIFRQKWLEMERFKPWLREILDDPSGFFCAVCDKAVTGGLSQIYRHADTKIHKSKCAEGGIPVSDDTEEDDSLSLFDEQKKSMEIRYAALIAEENIPNELAKKILNFFQGAGKTPNVLRSLSMGRTKCTNIISNVLCPVETNRIVDIIKDTPFSIYVNEMSGDLSQKWLLFYVRYVNPNTLQVHSQLVKLIDVNVSSSYTDKLFTAFNREMTNFQIPYANIIALSCDNANAMYGKHLFFKKKLKELCNNILVMSCPCHSAALAAHAACAKIPQCCEEFVKKIANYINNSPKRTSVFREFCKCFRERHRILSLQLSDTRWLSHHACIEKLLDSWDTIKRFLNERLKGEKIKVEKNLSCVMQNSDTKAYLLFLKYSLSVFEKFIASFRVVETKIHLLHPESINFLTNICTHFLKPDCINDLPNVEFSKSENHKDLEDINLGPECEEYLERLLQEGEGHKNLVLTVRSDCLQFYITAAEEISKRLPVNDEFLSKLEIFLPHIALLNRDRKTSFDDLMFIAQTLGGFDGNGLMEEWFKLNDDFTLEEKENLMKLNFDDMWVEILRSEYFLSHEVKYPHLKSLLNAIRSLPNSNMDPECIFTFLSDIKRTKRNKLSSSAVNAICVLKSALKTRGETVLNMTIDAKHISLMSSDKLYANFTKTKKKNNQQNAAANDDVNPSSSNTQ